MIGLFGFTGLMLILQKCGDIPLDSDRKVCKNGRFNAGTKENPLIKRHLQQGPFPVSASEIPCHNNWLVLIVVTCTRLLLRVTYHLIPSPFKFELRKKIAPKTFCHSLGFFLLPCCSCNYGFYLIPLLGSVQHLFHSFALRQDLPTSKLNQSQPRRAASLILTLQEQALKIQCVKSEM